MKTFLRFTVSTTLLGLTIWAIDSVDLWHLLRKTNPRWFMFALLLGIFANIVSAWRWHTIVQHLGLSASLPALLTTYGRNVTLNTILPGATLGGDAYRTVALQKLGNPILKAAASVAIDRFSGLQALFAISGLAWLALPVAFDVVPTAARITHLAVIALIIAAPFVARAFSDWLPFSHAVWLLSETARLTLLTFTPSVILQIANILALSCAMHAVSQDIPLLYLAALSAPVFLTTALPVSVGGYGTRETALTAYFILAGLPTEAAIAGGLVFGLAGTLQGAMWAPLFLVRHRG